MCVAGELEQSKSASMPPSSTPFPQMELYFKQLEEGRRGATEKKHQRKAGTLRVLPLEQLHETVNPSAIFQRGWQR